MNSNFNEGNWFTTPSHFQNDPFYDPESLANSSSNQEFKAIPLPDEDFTPYLNSNDLEDLFATELSAVQLGGIPAGNHQQYSTDGASYNGYVSSKTHSRKESGSAIFGFINHTHELSIPGVSISASNLKKGNIEQTNYSNALNEQYSCYTGNTVSQNVKLAAAQMQKLGNFQKQQQSQQQQQQEQQEQQQQHLKTNSSEKTQSLSSIDAEKDFFITAKSPNAYKFPLTPSDSQISKKVPSTPNRYHENKHSASNSLRYQQYLEQQGKFANNLQQKQEQYGEPGSRKYVDEVESSSNDALNHFGDMNDVMESQAIGLGIHRVENGKMVLAQAPKFYLLNDNQSSKTNLLLSNTELNYSSPEDQTSSGNCSPILNNQIFSPEHDDQQFISPQHQPPHVPTLQTPQTKLKLPAAPKLEADLSATPTKFKIIAKDQATIAKDYRYIQDVENTPKKQVISDQEKVVWTPVFVTKGDPQSAQIIKDQKKKISSPIRKETKITSTLPKGHLDQYFVGPDESKRFTCVYHNCGKTFSRISNTRAHIQTHLSDRPFPCNYCNKRFVRQHDLRRHEKSHQEFSFSCLCGKKFPRQDALKRHRIRQICVGGIEDDKSPEKQRTMISKPLKKRGRPLKGDMPSSVKDKILDDLNTYEDFYPEETTEQINNYENENFVMQGIENQINEVSEGYLTSQNFDYNFSYNPSFI
ncbi:hypothetical protein PACTADRAFT_49597 [Pachysolen tannophilus NRRL Y-2460]|uniref:C2H2-type domain-containing protein n=1 Tax=Pachysolen tannophilus NRRL Y-2460 TaxID=669874 RepID=A0A1E4TWS8_PACTA|nr:hypothetical protein PACTADRAFT_49597 [Pachysolen tannophilus NRRL Y-2460]